MPNMILWIGAMLVFLILEASTTALVSIWFAIGALAALVAGALGAAQWIQVLVFLLVSIISVVVIRIVSKGHVNNKIKKTNLDRIIGANVTITEKVDNAKNSGMARINDVDWKVKSETDEVIEAGEIATVTDIEGVKLVVKK